MLHKIGMPELLVILAIALVIFGGKALPKMGEAIGKTISNFKRGIRDDGDDDETTTTIDNEVTDTETANKANKRSKNTAKMRKAKEKATDEVGSVG